jgi:hypothetical protein
VAPVDDTGAISMWTINLPLGVQLSTKKWWMLNMNVYRNADFRTLNSAKIAFKDRVTPLLGAVPKLDRVLIVYTLFTPTKRLVDTANVCSIVDKFFCDTLVSAGKLEDDNNKVVAHQLFSWGGIDTNHPRVEATIHSIGPNFDICVTDG